MNPEIIVTGERIPRSLQETASSVVAITSDEIDAQAAADRIDQLLAFIPNIQLGSGTEGAAVRGQDSTGVLRELTAFLGGTRPRITLRVDGRASNYYEYIFGIASTWDVAQVEVFRSPQTTTQGRNAIAGAIFIETADPVYHWEAHARAIAGNYQTLHGSLSASGPVIADQLAFRLSGDLRRARNSSDMADAIPDARLDRDEFGRIRFKLLAEPKAVPGFRLETAYVHARSRAPQFEAVAPPFPARRVTAPQQTNGVMDVRSDSLTAVASYTITPALTSRTTLSWGDTLFRRFGLPGLGRTRADSQDWSVEQVFGWRPNGGEIDATGGVHWLRQDQRQSIDVTGLGLGIGSFADHQTSLGVFGEASWRLAPALKLTTGLRYQRDRQDRSGVLPRPGAPILFDLDRTFTAWLPKLSLAWDVRKGATAGLMVQRAYNPGGTTMNLATRTQDDFSAENLWNYELFLRGNFDGGRGRISGNIFYNDIEDAQRTQTVGITLPNGNTLFVPETGNAPSAESYGAEVEFGWRDPKRISVSAGVGLLGTKIRRTQLPNDPILGREFQRSPNLTASAAVEWWPAGPLSLSAHIRTHSGYSSDDANRAAFRIPGATVVNARAAYSLGGLTIFGYARNLFDNFYLTYLFPTFPGQGPAPVLGTAGDPRETGVGVEMRF